MKVFYNKLVKIGTFLLSTKDINRSIFKIIKNKLFKMQFFKCVFLK